MGRAMFSVLLRKRNLVRLVLAAVILVAAILEAAILVSYPIPPGSDPGLRIWSAIRLVSLGERREPYPAFDVTLATLWIACGGDMGRLSSFFAVFLSATMVLPIFIFAASLTENDGIALVSSFLIAFAFSIFEALSWGGYTSILALWFISAIFAALSKCGSWSLGEKVLVLTSLSTGLLMAHYWSFFVYFAMISVTFLFETLFEYFVRGRMLGGDAKIGIESAVLAVLVSSYWWAPISPFLKGLVGPSFTGLPVAMRLWDAGYLLYFLQPYDFYSLFVPIGVLAFAVQILRRRIRDMSSVFVLASWLAVPLALTQAYRLGISVDYARLCYFPIAPIVILSSIGLVSFLVIPYVLLTAFARTLRPRFGGFPVVGVSRRVLSLVLAYVLLQSILGVSFVATAHFSQAAVFYQTIRQPELKGILWLGFKTDQEADIAASSSLAWWINGLTGRDTIASMSLHFITARWQIPTTSAANIIIGDVSYQADNGLMRIEDSNPSGKDRNPAFVYDKDGKQETAAIFGDNGITVYWNGEAYALSQFRVVRMDWVAVGEGEVILETEYQLRETGLTVLKSVRMRERARFVEVDFEVHAPYGSLTAISIGASSGSELSYQRVIKGRIRGSDLKWAAVIDEKKDLFFALIADKWMRMRESLEAGRIGEWQTKFYSSGGDSMHAVIYVGAFNYESDNQTIAQVASYSTNPFIQEPDHKYQLMYVDYLSLIDQFQINFIATRPETAHKFELEPRTNLVYTSNRIRIFSVSYP